MFITEVLAKLLDIIVHNTNDRIAISEEELVLSNVAQPLPFTNIDTKIVKVTSVEFRIRKVGTPNDDTVLGFFTLSKGGVPTNSHGQYVGHNDFYSVTGKDNVDNFKIISSDGGAYIMYIVYYTN